MGTETGAEMGAVSPVGLELREQSVAAIRAAVALKARRDAAMRRARTLEATAIRLRGSARAEYLRCRARATRSPAPAPAPARGLIGFTVEGVVDERPVRARWHNGRLRCDEPLYQRALLLIDLGEELVYTDPPRRFAATLDGRPVAIALTLLRACDRVTAFQVDLPESAGVSR
jgi:hypothetical protein